MTNGHEAAYPHEEELHRPNRSLSELDHVWHYGLTKREYFAAMAASSLSGSFAELGISHAQEIARQSIEIADALIHALNDSRE